jgi:hypothetical protein
MSGIEIWFLASPTRSMLAIRTELTGLITPPGCDESWKYTPTGSAGLSTDLALKGIHWAEYSPPNVQPKFWIYCSDSSVNNKINSGHMWPPLKFSPSLLTKSLSQLFLKLCALKTHTYRNGEWAKLKNLESQRKKSLLPFKMWSPSLSFLSLSLAFFSTCV